MFSRFHRFARFFLGSFVHFIHFATHLSHIPTEIFIYLCIFLFFVRNFFVFHLHTIEYYSTFLFIFAPFMQRRKLDRRKAEKAQEKSACQMRRIAPQTLFKIYSYASSAAGTSSSTEVCSTAGAASLQKIFSRLPRITGRA